MVIVVCPCNLQICVHNVGNAAGDAETWVSVNLRF